MSDWLDQLIGEWIFEGRSVPDDPAHRRTGTESVSRRGVWTVIESSDGARFQLARNPVTGAITGDFVNWEDATLWTYDGAMDAEGRLHLRSRGPSLNVEGDTSDYDDVFEIISSDERIHVGRLLGADGRWRDFTLTRYRRKDAAP